MYRVLETKTEKLVGEFESFDEAKEVMDHHFPSQIIRDDGVKLRYHNPGSNSPQFYHNRLGGRIPT
jgi:hypothetical protein